MLLRVIRKAIGSVIKTDEHTNVAIRGRFARLVVCVDLRKPLISKVQINGKTQRVEYKYLPNIYFNCGLYGHTTALCLGKNIGMMENPTDTTAPVTEESDLINREGGIDNTTINCGVDFVSKEINNEVTVDLPKCGRDEFEGD
ncbi:hypothetical protein Golax_025941 [Gossypium laxum]|uniref:Zinc knuckle CX2CX4HX4C domain-containing protein n=1 Tax=Gossypium laxum TaxID=34288 RepID=A0A7J9AXX7_9ROSI|nr:hypothetical protein [Gossypium laxum]